MCIAASSRLWPVQCHAHVLGTKHTDHWGRVELAGLFSATHAMAGWPSCQRQRSSMPLGVITGDAPMFK
eukprot:scaffold76796_cov17-Prasinocladus_malaysianus.AAC.1